MHGIRQTPARAKQSENERLYVRDRHDLRAEQKIDDALRPAYVRLSCGGVWDANRRAVQDSGTLQYEYDAALGAAYRAGNAEDRPNIQYNIRIN